MGTQNVDILIIGAGPAGLYGAYYAGFRGMSVGLMDSLEEPGGQITAMYPEKAIFDVGGFSSIKGKDLIDNLLTQAKPSNPKFFLNQTATTLKQNPDKSLTITSESETINAKAVIITGGIGRFTPRALPAAEGWGGKGLVHFVPKLSVHAGKDVVIVGGGDSAFDWANELHPIAKSVTLIHRRDKFRAHQATIDKVTALGVPLITEAEVTKVSGSAHIEKIEYTNTKTKEVTELKCDTLVAALGFTANIGPLAEWGLNIDSRKIVVDSGTHTNLERVFAAGDISTYPGKVALISVGFGEAATAVNNATVAINPEAHLFPGHSSGSVE
ncbi:MAG: NAD(P)/FAD-dependent oxidoreductase [Candidatus Nanopelagicales bacterium]|nr:NAD(P)/FAD-dependent oxidoreductase [Candidatus Nanopelagicales bacterium]